MRYEKPSGQRTNPALREAIESFVFLNHGANATAVAQACGRNRTTALYHLRMLEREGHLFALKERGVIRYFPAGAEPRDRRSMAVTHLDEPAIRAILTRLLGGRMSVGQLARALRVTRTTVSWHLRRMEEWGMVWTKKRGRTRWIYKARWIKSDLWERPTS